MTTSSLDLRPRSRIVSLSSYEAVGLLRQANLGEDPYDPRQALAFASHGLLDWLETEKEDRQLDSPQTHPSPDFPPEVRSQWPEDLCGAGWIMEMSHGEHRLALFVATRRQGSHAPAPCIVSRHWLDCQQVDALCVCYVQIGAGPTEAVAVLLEGWLDAKQLARLQEESAHEEMAHVPVEPASLRPMGDLYDFLLRPAPGRHVRVASSLWMPAGWKLLLGWSLLATAAALLMGFRLAHPPTRVPDNATAAAVVEMDLRAAPVRAGAVATPVVYSDQKYALRVRTASPRSFGWVFNIDGRSATLLTRLTRHDDGTLSGEYEDSFDRHKGWEYFATVLADRDIPTDRLRNWLNEVELASLQQAGEKNDEGAARQVLRKALLRAGLEEGRFDVRIRLVKHE